jgi:hypothetical protein
MMTTECPSKTNTAREILEQEIKEFGRPKNDAEWAILRSKKTEFVYTTPIPPETLEKLRKLDLSELHIGWGVKCYYGAFDSRTDGAIRLQERVLKLLSSFAPGDVRVTYFPVEGKHSGWCGNQEITGLRSTRGDTIEHMVHRFLDANAAK